MALEYGKVKDMYDTLASAGVVTKSLPDWAAEMNQTSGSNLYDAGLHDNILKRTSYGIDKLLEKTGLPGATESFGRSIGEAVGDPEAGARVGRGLPRMALNFAPLAIPGLGEIGLAGKALQLGGSGLLSGAETYTATGSPAAGLISGATAAVLPGITNKAEQFALGKLGGRLVEGPLTDVEGNVTQQIKKFFPSSVGQKVGSNIVGQAAATGVMTGAGELENVASGQPLNNPFSTETLLSMTLGQAPFALMHGIHKATLGRGEPSMTEQANTLQYAIDKSKVRVEAKQAKLDLESKAPIEGIPDILPEPEPDSKVIVDTATRLATARGEQVTIADDPNLSPEDKIIKTAQALRAEAGITAEVKPPVPGSVIGDTIQATGPREQVFGHQLKAGTNWRFILVSDSEANPEALRGKVVKYSTTYEAPPVKQADGTTSYGLPEPQWRTTVTKDEWDAGRKGGISVPENPELPPQTEPITEEELQAKLHELDQVEIDVDAADTPAGFQSAVVKLNSVEHEHELPPTKDTTLRKRATLLASDENVPADQIVASATKAQARQTAKLIKAQQRTVDIQTAEQFRAEQERFVQDNPDDEETSTEVSNLQDLEGVLGAKPGPFADALLGGDLNRLYKKWVDGGRKGDWEAFARSIDTIAKTGKGLLKRELAPVTHEIANVTKEPTTDTVPIGNIVTEATVSILRGQAGKDAFNGWKDKADVNFREDALMFHKLVNEFGRVPEIGDLDDAAELLHQENGTDFVEAKDELANFITRPYVKVWEEQLEGILKSYRDINAAPGATPVRTIVRTALRNTANPDVVVSGEVWNSPHASFMMKALENGIELDNKLEHGFIVRDADGTEHFAGRDEAAQVVRESGQGRVDPGKGLQSQDLVTPAPVEIIKRTPAQFQQGEDFVPTNTEDRALVDATGVASGGLGLHQALLNSANSFVVAVAKDLAKFPESLKAITAKFMTTDGTFARSIGNRAVDITLSHGLLNVPEQTRDLIILHELVHGMTTIELSDPNSPFRKQIVDLRQHLIDALPKEQRASLDKALAEGWYGKYSTGQVSFDSLHPDGIGRQIIYGLLTEHELLAQGFSSTQMREFMRRTKASGQENWYSRFTNTVKELFGIRTPGNAFEEFLAKSDTLIQQGEYITTLSDYTTRFFENLGLSRGLVNLQSRRALGIVLDSQYGISKEQILTQLALNPGESADFSRAHRDVIQMFQDKDEDLVNTLAVLDEHGFSADVGGIHALTQEALQVGLPNFSDIMDVMPSVASKYVFAQLHDMQMVLSGLKAATGEAISGLVNLADPVALRGPVGEALTLVQELLKIEKSHANAQEIVDGLHVITPDGYLQHVTAAPAMPEWLPEADKTRKTFGSWIKRLLQPMGQMARDNPAAAEVLSKGFQLMPNVRKMMAEGLKVFGLDLDALGSGDHVLSKESVARVERALKSPKIERAVNKWIYENQKKGRIAESVTLLPDTDPEVRKALAGLSAQELKDVSEIVTKHQISQQFMQEQQLEKMLQIGATNGAVVAGRSTRLKTSQNITLSDTLLRALVVDRADPTAAAAADGQIGAVQGKMSVEGFNSLLQYTQGEAAKWQAWKEHFAKNPAWSSGQRYGKFLVTYKKAGKVFLAGVESRKEADAVAEGGVVTKFEKNVKDEVDAAPVLGPDAVGLVTRLQEIERSQIGILSGVMSPTDMESIRRTSVVAQFTREIAAREGIPGVTPPPRGLTRGAEELPWLSNHFSWVNKSSNYWSRQLLRAQSRAHLLDPEIAQNRQLQSDLKTHFDNLFHPDTDFGRNLHHFTSTWFMGFNPASAMVNATQPFLTHVAEFTALTGKPVDSYRRVVRALGELTGKGVTRGDWKTPDHEWFMTNASHDGERNYSMFDDEAAANEAVATNYKRVLSRNRTQTLGQHLATPVGAFAKASMLMFRGVEQVNNDAALLSSFDYYREQGLGREAARDKAYEFNHAVNFGGGRAQRSIGAFSGRGAFPRTVAMTATALQNYVLGTTFQLTRYIQKGFFRPAGITPHEVYAARRAAVQMIGTQLFAAGTLGLPFVSGAIALLNKAFPGLEMSRHIQELVRGLFASDKDNGEVLGDVAMTGVPSMFGWDLQSRLSMGNTLPGVSEINGFQPGLLLGPPANLISTFVGGATKLASGDFAGATQSLVPSAMKKLISFASSKGQVHDYRDRPIFTPTVGETVGLALGFQPKRLTNFNTASNITEQNRLVTTHRQNAENQSLAEEVLQGNFGTVRQSLLDKAQSDKNYNPLDAVRTIARAAEALTFPRDLRREGSAATSDVRSRLLSSLRIDPSQPSEVARLQFREQVEQRLGLRSDHRSEQVLAGLMDRLRNQQPDATRLELRQQADRLLRGPQLQSLQEPL